MATTRGFVAVNFSFDSRTDKVECVAREDMVIPGENGASVSLSKGEKFTAVRAASLGENMWYLVRDVTGFKKCSCAAMKPCKHEISVATGRSLAELQAEAEARKVAKSRKSKVSQAVASKVAQAERIVATGTFAQNAVAAKVLKADVSSTIQPIEFAKVASADHGARGNLNTSRAFSLMR